MATVAALGATVVRWIAATVAYRVDLMLKGRQP
jgi:hypothetical protein